MHRVRPQLPYVDLQETDSHSVKSQSLEKLSADPDVQTSQTVADLTSLGVSTVVDASDGRSRSIRQARRVSTAPPRLGRWSDTIRSTDDDVSVVVSYSGAARSGIHTLRNTPSVLVANGIAEHALQKNIRHLTAQHREILGRCERARSAFIDRLKARGGPLGQLVDDIERGRLTPSTNGGSRRSSLRCRSAVEWQPRLSANSARRDGIRPPGTHSLPLRADYVIGPTSSDILYKELERVNFTDRLEFRPPSVMRTPLTTRSATSYQLAGKESRDHHVIDRKCSPTSNHHGDSNEEHTKDYYDVYEPFFILERSNRRMVLVPAGQPFPVPVPRATSHASDIASLLLRKSEISDEQTRHQRTANIQPPRTSSGLGLRKVSLPSKEFQRSSSFQHDAQNYSSIVSSIRQDTTVGN